MPSEPEHVHVVGVAGVGMNALAQLLANMSFNVTGSDRFFDQGRTMPIKDRLIECGIILVRQDGSSVDSATKVVVVSSAIEEDNPDIQKATRLEIPVIHRADMLEQLIRGKSCIAIAGTSGKTTVTGLCGWLLEQGNFDPVVVNGGSVLNWNRPDSIGNVRFSENDLWVIETDESDRSLLKFSPDWAVLTNMSEDHYDLEETKNIFRTFVGQVETGLVCGEGVLPLLRSSECDEAISRLQIIDEPFVLSSGSDGFIYKDLTFTPGLAGNHNLMNAFHAVLMCERIGMELEFLQEVLPEFEGIERRLQRIGGAHEVEVFDDYAHNPEKIKAAWSTLAEKYPRVLGIWRPHGYGPLAQMVEPLIDTFLEVCRPFDKLMVLPVFYAGGSVDRQIDSEEFVRKLAFEDIPATLVKHADQAQSVVLRMAQPGDAILVMGARDPGLPILARNMVEGLNAR